MVLSTSRKGCYQAKSVSFKVFKGALRSDFTPTNAKWWSKSSLVLPPFPVCKMFPFKNGFEKYYEQYYEGALEQLQKLSSSCGRPAWACPRNTIKRGCTCIVAQAKLKQVNETWGSSWLILDFPSLKHGPSWNVEKDSRKKLRICEWGQTSNTLLLASYKEATLLLPLTKEN